MPSNTIRTNYDQRELGQPLKSGLQWLFLAALILVLWQVPLINMAYRQAGIRTFLQAAFQKGDLPANVPWSGQVETDPGPAVQRLQQAGDPLIPLQLPLNVDRLVGVVTLITGDATEAQKQLQNSLERESEDQITRFFLGEAYHRLGDTDAAIEQWSTVGAEEPLMELAKELIEREEKSQAMPALEAAMRLDETDTQPRWLAAEMLREQGAAEEALVLYQEIRTINPRSEAARKQVANIWLQQGNLEQALAEYQEMINLAPQRSTGYALMGEALFKAQRYEEAIKSLQEALQHGPEEPGLLLEMLGESYAALGRWLEAIPAYRQAIEANPNRYRTYVLMGDAQCQAGTPGDARFYFEQAVALGNQQTRVQQAIQYITEQGLCPP